MGTFDIVGAMVVGVIIVLWFMYLTRWRGGVGG